MSEEKDVTATNVSTSAAQQVVISDNEAVHRYRMTVDLRAIKDLTSSYNVYLRFSYSLFGPQPNSTAPAIEVRKGNYRLIVTSSSSLFERLNVGSQANGVLNSQGVFQLRVRCHGELIGADAAVGAVGG